VRESHSPTSPPLSTTASSQEPTDLDLTVVIPALNEGANLEMLWLEQIMACRRPAAPPRDA
jgi:hypothetical protein